MASIRQRNRLELQYELASRSQTSHLGTRTFIDEETHLACLGSQRHEGGGARDLVAKRKQAWIFSWVRPSYSFSISSTVAPCARSPRTYSTVSRVPLMTGFPTTTEGSKEMFSNSCWSVMASASTHLSRIIIQATENKAHKDGQTFTSDSSIFFIWALPNRD